MFSTFFRCEMAKMPTGNSRLRKRKTLNVDIRRGMNDILFVALYHTSWDVSTPKLFNLSYIREMLQEFDPNTRFDRIHGWQLNMPRSVRNIARSIRKLLQERKWLLTAAVVESRDEFEAEFEYEPSF